MMNVCTPTHWTDYELIDTGGSEKLERFGKYILARPEPQAVWSKSIPGEEWEKMCHARYKRKKGKDPAGQDQAEKGEWIRKPNMPEQWKIGYTYKEMHLIFRLGLTNFGHIGVFPEQAENWDFIYDIIQRYKSEDRSQKGTQHSKPRTAEPVQSSNHQRINIPGNRPRILNLFAYTGGSSLAARSAGADVVHVDSVRPVVTWAREMMEASGLKDIRWVVEDALKFAQREARRGNRYDGIILDPPAYGRGPEGEKWILEDSVNEMIGLCRQLLPPETGFLIFSLYSMGFSPLVSESLLRTHFGETLNPQAGELFFPDRAGRKLPLGTFLRIVLDQNIH